MPYSQTRLAQLYNLSSDLFSKAYDLEELIAHFRVHLPPILIMEPNLSRLNKSFVDTILSEILSFIVKSRKESIYESDLLPLKNLIIRLPEYKLEKLSSLLEVFLISFNVLTEKRPEKSHSYFEAVLLKCSKCHNKGEYFFWRIINTMLRNDLYEFVASGKIFNNNCHYCGNPIEYLSPFFYCNPNRDDYLLFYPRLDEKAMKEVRDKTLQYIESLPSEFRGQKSLVAFVSDYIAAPWQNADDYNLIFHIDNGQELMKIINARIMLDTVSTISAELVLDNTRHVANHEFQNGNYRKAAHLYTIAFLKDPKQFSWLFHISACLFNLNEDEKANYLKSEAQTLRKKLREVGVVYDVRDNWSLRGFDKIVNISLDIEKSGLPKEWGFEKLVSFLQELSKDLEPEK